MRLVQLSHGNAPSLILGFITDLFGNRFFFFSDSLCELRPDHIKLQRAFACKKIFKLRFGSAELLLCLTLCRRFIFLFKCE
jgi:hypothetical protein